MHLTRGFRAPDWTFAAKKPQRRKDAFSDRPLKCRTAALAPTLSPFNLTDYSLLAATLQT